MALARRVAELFAGYDGPLALESFDPDPIAFLRAEGAALGVGHVPLGMVAQARYDANEWPELPEARRAELAQWLHFSRTRPDFLSFNALDMPHAVAVLFREGLKRQVTVLTVRSGEQARAAARWADRLFSRASRLTASVLEVVLSCKCHEAVNRVGLYAAA